MQLFSGPCSFDNVYFLAGRGVKKAPFLHRRIFWLRQG